VNAGLRDPRFRRLVLGLALLQIAAALTEGVGLVLLVPLLSALAGPTGADAGPLARAAAGLSQNLPALLALFVLLVAARSALVLARSRPRPEPPVAASTGWRWSAAHWPAKGKPHRQLHLGLADRGTGRRSCASGTQPKKLNANF
jgi:hypothetical protein